jgi:hypothetical protein
VFDVLSRVPEGDERLPDFSRLLKRHAKALEQLDIPLASSLPRFRRASKPRTFDTWSGRAGQSLLLVEGDDGRTLGAWMAIRWPELGKPAQDVWLGSFLFIIDGENEVARRKVPSRNFRRGAGRLGSMPAALCSSDVD